MLVRAGSAEKGTGLFLPMRDKMWMFKVGLCHFVELNVM